MPHCIAVLPSLTRCASLLAGELEKIPAHCQSSEPATADAAGVNLWTAQASGQLRFICKVSLSDLREHLPTLALALAA